MPMRYSILLEKSYFFFVATNVYTESIDPKNILLVGLYYVT
jgi:hypothetical protein